jgi:hypothetical protein
MFARTALREVARFFASGDMPWRNTIKMVMPDPRSTQEDPDDDSQT